MNKKSCAVIDFPPAEGPVDSEENRSKKCDTDKPASRERECGYRPDIPPLLKTISGLSEAWRERADQFQEHRADGVAFTYRKCAEELEAEMRISNLRTVSLKEAAEITGYNADHLRRMVREGRLPNVGETGSLRFCIRDLPRKPSSAGGRGPSSARSASEIIREVVEDGRVE